MYHTPCSLMQCLWICVTVTCKQCSAKKKNDSLYWDFEPGSKSSLLGEAVIAVLTEQDELKQQFYSVHGWLCSLSPSNNSFSKEWALATRFNVLIYTLSLLFRTLLSGSNNYTRSQVSPRGMELLFLPFITTSLLFNIPSNLLGKIIYKLLL